MKILPCRIISEVRHIPYDAGMFRSFVTYVLHYHDAPLLFLPIIRTEVQFVRTLRISLTWAVYILSAYIVTHFPTRAVRRRRSSRAVLASRISHLAQYSNHHHSSLNGTTWTCTLMIIYGSSSDTWVWYTWVWVHGNVLQVHVLYYGTTFQNALKLDKTSCDKIYLRDRNSNIIIYDIG